MPSINTIFKEIKDLPLERLEELSQYVHSLNPKKEKNDNAAKKILSFAGVFSDMSDKDYADFLQNTKNARADLFGRKVEL